MAADTTQPPLGIVVVSALAALVLQLVVAPVIALFGIVPNILLVVAIVTAMHNGPVRATIVGFILGLALDFVSLGPTGSMALVFTIISYAVSSLNKGVFTGGLVVDCVIMLAAIALGEFLTSVVYAITGVNSEFLLSLVQRVLPGIAYDALFGFLVLLVYNALTGNRPTSPSTGGGRSLSRKIKL